MNYPEQRYVMQMTSFTRQSLLPEEAIGAVNAKVGDRVDIKEVVARGTIPLRFKVIEAAAQLRLKDAQELYECLQVEVGTLVDLGRPLAAKGRRAITAPFTGIFAYCGQGRIIMQETSDVIDQTAGVAGQVVKIVPGRGVVIESAGALVQGAWGSGGSAIGIVRIEPEDGLENVRADEFDAQVRGAIMVTRRPLKLSGLTMMDELEFGGIIAPSMDSVLREVAMVKQGAIMLTEGFGSMRMNSTVFNLFSELAESRALCVLDAARPDRFGTRRPELVATRAVGRGERPPTPTAAPLKTGMNVLITREPHAGLSGKITDLPKTPYLLDNGLRVQCARIELLTGGTVLVPLANLEVYGR